MDFESKIDIKKIVDTIKKLKIIKPNILKIQPEQLNIEMVSTLQLIYDKESLFINRYYLKCNNSTELVLDKSYEFHAFNYFENNICYSYDAKGILKYTYSIKEKSETENILITKSNGDEYFQPDKLIEEYELEKIRRSLIKNLLCYCKKSDDRFCFYIRIRKTINYFALI